MSSTKGDVTVYNPLELCQIREFDSVFPLIILNQPLDDYGEIVTHLWEKACFRAMSDGGANRLYHYIEAQKKNVNDFIPDLISGDFDSIQADVKEFYKSKTTTIIHTPDDNYTDFTKTMELVVTEMEKRMIKFDYIVALVHAAGRFDHCMGNIQSLFLVRAITKKPVFLLADNYITWLLDTGKHRIYVNKTLNSLTCGLIPIGEPADHVTTTGLKWNLDNQRLKFGELISTSNTYDGENVVTVDTDKPLLWTMETQL